MENKEIAVKEELTPMAMINLAVANGADVDKIRALMDLQERWEAGEAKKAFDKAFLEFQKQAPKIVKTKSVSFKQDGPVAYMYSPLNEVAETLRAVLNPLGFTFRWENEKKSEKEVKVTCVLTHEKGHSKTASMEGPYDTSGAKNGIQAAGSSDSYLKRYTLFSVTGMTAQDDDDGRKSDMDPAKMISESDLLDFIANIDNAENEDDLKKAYFDAYNVATKKGDMAAIGHFLRARDTRLKAIKGKK